MCMFYHHVSDVTSDGKNSIEHRYLANPSITMWPGADGSLSNGMGSMCWWWPTTCTCCLVMIVLARQHSTCRRMLGGMKKAPLGSAQASAPALRLILDPSFTRGHQNALFWVETNVRAVFLRVAQVHLNVRALGQECFDWSPWIFSVGNNVWCEVWSPDHVLQRESMLLSAPCQTKTERDDDGVSA